MMLRYSIVCMELTGMYKWKRFSGQHSKLYRSGSAIFSILRRVILLGIMADVERKTRKHPLYSTWFLATALYKKALSLSTEFFGTMLYIEGNNEVILIIVKQKFDDNE